jgi:outer membrane immunogenic protein
MRAEVVGSEIDEALSGNGDGLRLGAGIEFALGRGAYAKTEYRYSNYEGGVTRNQVITGLGFRF